MRPKLSAKLATHSIIKPEVNHPAPLVRTTATVPNHRELAKGTLRALIREAGLTKEQFAELL